jgi:hypothetical protein
MHSDLSAKQLGLQFLWGKKCVFNFIPNLYSKTPFLALQLKINLLRTDRGQEKQTFQITTLGCKGLTTNVGCKSIELSFPMTLNFATLSLDENPN